MFVMASLAAHGGSGPVRVRNLSTTGALIEGGVLPNPGEAVFLSRGALRTEGKVVWTKNGRAGLHFKARVIVSEWLPNGVNRSGQQRTDEIFRKLKSEGLSSHPRSDVQDLPPSVVTRSDIEAILRGLEELSEALAEDDLVVIRHGSKLQVLDAAVQALTKLAAHE